MIKLNTSYSTNFYQIRFPGKSREKQILNIFLNLLRLIGTATVGNKYGFIVFFSRQDPFPNSYGSGIIKSKFRFKE